MANLFIRTFFASVLTYPLGAIKSVVTLLQQKHFPEVEELMREVERTFQQKEQAGYSSEAAFRDLKEALTQASSQEP